MDDSTEGRAQPRPHQRNACTVQTPATKPGWHTYTYCTARTLAYTVIRVPGNELADRLAEVGGDLNLGYNRIATLPSEMAQMEVGGTLYLHNNRDLDKAAARALLRDAPFYVYYC